MASSSSSTSTLNNQQVSQPNASFVLVAPIKLTNANYLLWKTQVLPSIRANGLEAYIDGNKEAPRKMTVSIDQDSNVITIENPEYLVWERHDQMLMSWLLSSMTKGILGTVMGCRSSKEVWEAMQKHFSAQSTARTMQIRSEIHNTKKDGMSVNDYYLKMKSLVEDLRCAGNEVSEEEHVMFLMEGLGPEYDPVVVNITSRERKLPLQEIYSVLVSHENRIERNLSSGRINLAQNPSANYTQTNYSYPKKNWLGGAIHNQPSGVQNQSFGNSQGRTIYRNMGEREVKTFQIYFKNGHEAYKCWYRFNKKFMPKQGGKPSQKKAYIAHPETVADPNWYLDSGATNHVTNNLANIDIAAEYKGTEQLAVGHALLPTMHSHTLKPLLLKHILYVPAITKNLISISKLLKDNIVNVVFDDNICLIKDKLQGRILLQGVARGNLSKCHDSTNLMSQFHLLPKSPEFIQNNQLTADGLP
ncbi:Retrovirus-related Pol polyprotein from transposon TNT 1-94 [Melia azedarach]|uniref:Retrovirus-related Pol polyprotein from transposon TNT 1-94 n=1 Tax=Melia azedarach TaxID=155640 RepID=A0ACC1YGE2_MELAZ|nr:Retrovirus-related Pol polyprotein from transposon TNT 1-94 [Melia azedarach]